MTLRKSSKNKRYEAFKEGGRLIAAIRDDLAKLAQTEHDMGKLDQEAERRILEVGGYPAFKRVPGYHWTTCISVNSTLVHGIPKGKFEVGDIVTIDIGMVYKGYITDTAVSFVVGTPTKEQGEFLAVGQLALENAIKAAVVGNTVRDITKATQDTIEAAGYAVTRNLTGHGLGHGLHEEPAIPCYISDDPVLDTPLKEGMVLAIEPMYMQGKWQLTQSQDGWNLATSDGKLSAHFEDDIYLTAAGPEILTQV